MWKKKSLLYQTDNHRPRAKSQYFILSETNVNITIFIVYAAALLRPFPLLYLLASFPHKVLFSFSLLVLMLFLNLFHIIISIYSNHHFLPIPSGSYICLIVIRNDKELLLFIYNVIFKMFIAWDHLLLVFILCLHVNPFKSFASSYFQQLFLFLSL